MKLYRWENVPKQQPVPLMDRRALHTETMTVAYMEFTKGCVLPEHSHHNEQISMVEQGRMRFVVAGAETVLEAGQVVYIPGNVAHSVEALEDSVVKELFSPPRLDWPRDDNYSG